MAKERKIISRIIADAGKRLLKPVDLHEAKIIATADSFQASRFMGAGKYELRSFDNLEMGLGFLELHPKERWMLYAVKDGKTPEETKRSVLVTPLNLAAARELMEKMK